MGRQTLCSIYVLPLIPNYMILYPTSSMCNCLQYVYLNCYFHHAKRQNVGRPMVIGDSDDRSLRRHGLSWQIIRSELLLLFYILGSLVATRVPSWLVSSAESPVLFVSRTHMFGRVALSSCIYMNHSFWNEKKRTKNLEVYLRQ